MFNKDIWPILLVVIHNIEDEQSEINHLGEILITFRFSQIINQLKIYTIICNSHFVLIFAYNSTVLIATAFILQISYPSIKRH